jgi:hypothetical protein
LEYNPTISYIAGQTNALADALSRPPAISDLQASLSQLSSSTALPDSDFLNQVRESYKNSPWVTRIRSRMVDTSKKEHHLYFQRDDLLYHTNYDGRSLLVLPPNSKVLTRVLEELHATPSSGHRGALSTVHKFSRAFHTRGQNKLIRRFVSSCSICQRSKKSPALRAPAQPLDIPPSRWTDVSLDFVFDLPPVDGLDGVCVFVDRLTKRAHFLPCAKTISAEGCASLYLQRIFPLHGLPASLLSDRDVRFVSQFWSTLWKSLKTTLKLSTAHHPQTDGQSEVVNKSMNSLLRIFTNYRMTNWPTLLPVLEYAFNASYNQSIDNTPFQLDLGYIPRGPADVVLGTTSSVDASVPFIKRLSMDLALAKDSIHIANAVLKARGPNVVDQFQVDDQVLVLSTLLEDPAQRRRPKRKWRPIYAGPYRVAQVVSPQVYRIDFPDAIKAHRNVNVQHLKRFHINDDTPSSRIVLQRFLFPFTSTREMSTSSTKFSTTNNVHGASSPALRDIRTCPMHGSMKTTLWTLMEPSLKLFTTTSFNIQTLVLSIFVS